MAQQITTGGGKLFIRPDEAQDRLPSMLGTTCSGFSVEFGGDREKSGTSTTATVIEDPGFQSFHGEVRTMTGDNVVIDYGGGGGGGSGDGGLSGTNFTPKLFLFNTPKYSLNKRRRLLEEVQTAQREKELAMTAYFRAKTKKIDLENQKLQLLIEQLEKTQVVISD